MDFLRTLRYKKRCVCEQETRGKYQRKWRKPMCLQWKYVTVLSAEGKAEFASVPLNNTDVPSNKSVDCDKGQRTSHNQWRFVMNTYQNKFINMMDEANSKELVEKLYDQCCANCTYRFVCNERACGVTWAKDGAIERLKENDKMLVHLHIVFPERNRNSSPSLKQPKRRLRRPVFDF